MTARWVVALALFAAFGTAGAQSSGGTVQETLVDQRDLFNFCSRETRMDLSVGELPGHAAHAGLTQERVREVIESRLRRARIYDRNAESLLQAVIVVGKPQEGRIPFYSIELAYLRVLVEERLGLVALAETWSRSSAGQGDADSFLAHLGNSADAFVAEYLRVQISGACREAR